MPEDNGFSRAWDISSAKVSKAELISIAKPFYFGHHAGQMAVASSVKAKAGDKIVGGGSRIPIAIRCIRQDGFGRMPNPARRMRALPLGFSETQMPRWNPPEPTGRLRNRRHEEDRWFFPPKFILIRNVE
ncbi:MAG: hypothetical protein WCS31_17010 [Verrucomicrobiae bacterium]